MSQPSQPNSSNIVPLPTAPATPANVPNKAWKSKLQRKGTSKDAPIAKNLHNVHVALRNAPELVGLFRLNEFSHAIEIHRAPPWEKNQTAAWSVIAFEKYEENMLTEWLQRNGIDVQKSLACEGTYTVAKENSYHPVRDYLLGLKWDGVKRLDTWLSVYLGAEDTPYHRAIAPRWIISGVARIMVPGPDCKADCVLILEGKQGDLKSTVLREIAGKWFLDDLRQFGSKDAAMKLANRWIIELAELTAMNEVTVEACKAFFGQVEDSFRPPYERAVIMVPRQCIFAATTNKNVFLKDETGDRRYWPVACGKIDVAAVKRDRDQLWAEALVRFRAGNKWWLETPELRALAETEQEQRFDSDPWEQQIRRWLRGYKQVTPEEILTDLLDYEPQRINRGLHNRVAAVLRHLKWQRQKIAGDNGQQFVYARVAETLL